MGKVIQRLVHDFEVGDEVIIKRYDIESVAVILAVEDHVDTSGTEYTLYISMCSDGTICQTHYYSETDRAKEYIRKTDRHYGQIKAVQKMMKELEDERSGKPNKPKQSSLPLRKEKAKKMLGLA